MSVLSTPRIYFRGNISWDPIVTNNIPQDYNEDTGDTVFPTAADRVAAFRKQAIAESLTDVGNWNPHGTHRSSFFETTVTGFDLGQGLQTEDPFVTAAVRLNGMLVDIEPYGVYSSQIFFDELHFGVDGGYRILAPRTTRWTDRYINFGRNPGNDVKAGIASVLWQTSFAKVDGLRVDAYDSPALQSLAAELESDDVLGLTVRFDTYRTIYFDDPNLRQGSAATEAAFQALNAKLNNGGFQPNPARSLVVGVLGLWYKGEPAHEPGDRSLNPTPTTNKNLAAIQARFERETLTLDLSNSVSETDADLTKANLQTLSVVSVDPITQAITTLGSFGYDQYDRRAYETTSGLVTIAVPAEAARAAATRDLQLRDATGAVQLTELRMRAIPNTPNLYLDEGDQVTASFQVYDRGLPATSQQNFTLYQMDYSGNTVLSQSQVSTDPHGLLVIPLSATTGNVIAYVPSFGPLDNPSQGLNTQTNTYMYVRVRPADGHIAQLAPTWDNVYALVLANWNAMAPCMDNWLKLDDPAQILSFAAVVMRLTDPANFESYRFMPVTRDMSQGERTLLYNFLATAPQLTTTPPLGKTHLAALSRAMRTS